VTRACVKAGANGRDCDCVLVITWLHGANVLVSSGHFDIAALVQAHLFFCLFVP